MNSLSVTDLFLLAGGLNIEGGFPCMDLTHESKKRKIWANLVLVLDRPLIDNVLFDEIFANNKYPLLENNIDDINEHKLFCAYLMIVMHYANNGRRILGIPENDQLNMVIHVHQAKSCQPLIDLMVEHLHKAFGDRQTANNNTVIEFRTDEKSYLDLSYDYSNTDILISLSQCAGLDPLLRAGDWIVPNQFIPYDINNKTIYFSRRYNVENDLIYRLSEILDSSDHQKAVEVIGNHYQSSNISKNNKHKVEALNINDFHVSNILQVDKLWNPEDKSEKIRVVVN